MAAPRLDFILIFQSFYKPLVSREIYAGHIYTQNPNKELFFFKGMYVYITNSYLYRIYHHTQILYISCALQKWKFKVKMKTTTNNTNLYNYNPKRA